MLLTLAVTLLALDLVIFLYNLAGAAAANWLGVTVASGRVGYGPTLFTLSGPICPWRVGLLPLGGEVQFAGDEDAEGMGFRTVSAGGQLAIMLAGPFFCVALGLALLALPVAAGGRQLAVVAPAAGTITPCACGGLTLLDEPTTAHGQAAFWEATFPTYLVGLLTFRRMDGWGGLVGAILTVAAVAAADGLGWVTCLGVLTLGMGLSNLLPSPLLNGGKAVILVVELARGRPFGDRARDVLTWLALAVTLVIFGRMLWLDACWLFGW